MAIKHISEIRNLQKGFVDSFLKRMDEGENLKYSNCVVLHRELKNNIVGRVRDLIDTANCYLSAKKYTLSCYDSEIWVAKTNSWNDTTYQIQFVRSFEFGNDADDHPITGLTLPCTPQDSVRYFYMITRTGEIYLLSSMRSMRTPYRCSDETDLYRSENLMKDEFSLLTAPNTVINALFNITKLFDEFEKNIYNIILNGN